MRWNKITRELFSEFSETFNIVAFKETSKEQLVQFAINDLFGKYDLMRVKERHESVIFTDKILQEIYKVDKYRMIE